MRKHLLIRGKNAFEAGCGHLINLNPLHKHAFVRQPLATHLEKVFGEKIRNTRNPRMARLRNDHIVFVLGNAQVGPRVVDYHPQSGIGKRFVIHVLKEFAGIDRGGFQFQTFKRLHI